MLDGSAAEGLSSFSWCLMPPSQVYFTLYTPNTTEVCPVKDLVFSAEPFPRVNGGLCCFIFASRVEGLILSPPQGLVRHKMEVQRGIMPTFRSRVSLSCQRINISFPRAELTLSTPQNNCLCYTRDTESAVHFSKSMLPSPLKSLLKLYR